VSISSTLDEDVPADLQPSSGSGSDDGAGARGAARRPAAERLRLVAVCVALFALALKQAPSQLVGDTKLDLAVDPVRFLTRALHLWDPSSDFGLTQNQSYGYLFPMGPFFALGHLVGLPMWMVQRLWWGLLLSLAFLGVVKLAERLELGSPFSRLVGGLAFALSPRVLSTVGPISVETLPYCLSPWVLLPLVTGARGGSTRRAAARSGLAVLCMGAVNAAAVLAVLPPAALYLLTRQPGPRRRSLLRWWVASAVLATTWWVVPLLLLGRYSPPFLDYIENSSITTSVTSLIEVLRGTSDWVAYVGGGHGPSWPAGSALLTTPLVILYTVLVVAAGVVGLLRRDLPERAWLTLCLLLGVAAVTAGHTGAVTGLLAGTERDLLDGVLAPFRNVHKFDAVLRLPLVLGVVHLVSSLPGRRAAAPADHVPARRRGLQQAAFQAAALAAVLGAALPALSTGLAPRAPFVEIPSYWQQTATWLADHQARGRALLLPGSRFPDYLWGSTNEPLQALARSSWAVRGAVPLTPPGTIRYLDAVEQQLAAGRPSVGLADDLARAGIHYLVVRNDLDYGAASSTRPLLVHEALVGSAGIDKVAQFGGQVGGGGLAGYVDEGLEVPYPAVEVYQVSRSTPRASLHPLSDVLRVAGGPESLLPLDDRFLLKGRPVVLEADAAGVPALAASPTLLTDGLRRREVFFGGTQNESTSATLTADDPFRLGAPAHDYSAPDYAGRQTVARLLGAQRIEASSSASDADALGGAQRSHLPYAAVDGELTTSWRSDAGHPVAQASWQIRFDVPQDLSGLQVRFDVSNSGTRPVAVTVRTDTAAVTVPVPADGRAVPVRGLPASTSSLTIATARTRGTGLGYLGITEVQAPGLTVSRTLDTALGSGTPVIALNADASGRNDCYLLVTDYLCSSTVGRPGEESASIDRTLHLDGSGSYRLFASAVPRQGAALDAVLDGGTGVGVTASSSAVSAPAARPGTVLDGDLGTGWRAASGDRDPALTISYASPQTVTGLRLRVQPSLAGSQARAVRVESADGTREGKVGKDGTVSFPALVTSSLTVHLEDVVPAVSRDPFSLAGSLLLVGVSELTVVGAERPRTPPFLVTVPCSVGPVLRVGNTLLSTSVRTDRDALQRLAPLTLTVCGSNVVDVGDGARVVAPAASIVRPVSVTLRPGLGDPLSRPARADVQISLPRWDATTRRVSLPARPEATLLQVHENTNPGWVATLAGRRLRPVVVDGWQQGWVVPAGSAGTVALAFAPDHTFRRGLLVGALAALVLLALALVRGSTTSAPAASRRTGTGLALGLVAVLALIGGVAALALCLVVAALLAAGRRRDQVRTTLAFGALSAAGVLLALDPWPGTHYAGRAALPQALCVTGLVLVWSALLPTRRPLPNFRSFRRRAGRSTTT
jgi:arabinofuranan 3-O-arabinosyltransferase